MHILLLATDEQPKLRLLTETLPTPLVPIVNRPVMAVAVEILARAGYKDLFVSLCDGGGRIASYFGNGSRWGVEIEYLIQREGWGSAGALAWAGQLLTETVLVLPADSIIDLDVDAALAFHRAHGGIATMILHDTAGDRTAHPVYLGESDLVQAIGADQPDRPALAHTGAFLFEPRVLQYIPNRTYFDSYSQLVPALLSAGEQVYGYHMLEYWNGLDSFQDYQEAQQVFLYSAYEHTNPGSDAHMELSRVRFPSIEGQQIAPGIWVGHNHIIHPSARLAPPLCIGEGCRIGYGVELGPEVVIGSNVVIDDDATIFQSTVLDRTYVGQLVNINNRVIYKTTLIDAQTSESTQVIDPFLLAETRLVTKNGWLRRALTVLGALMLLIVTLPLTLSISLVVAITSGGRVFARSPRVGRVAGIESDQANVRTFDLLAFRILASNGTMSRFGRFLHYWELDRIPELWSVLKGDLELVGVKPLLPEEAAALNEEWHLKRYECPPGFTGLWYIQTSVGSDLDDILVADVYYAATHNWRDDLRLFWRTPAAWQNHRRAQRQRNSKDNDLSGQIDNFTII